MTTHIRLHPGMPTLCGSDSETWTYAKRTYWQEEMCQDCLDHEDHGLFQLRVLDKEESPWIGIDRMEVDGVLTGSTKRVK